MVKQSWENLGISKKIFTLVAVLVLFTLLTGAGYHYLVGRVRDMAVEQTTAIMMQDYRGELKNLVDSLAPLPPPLGSGARSFGGKFRCLRNGTEWSRAAIWTANYISWLCISLKLRPMDRQNHLNPSTGMGRIFRGTPMDSKSFNSVPPGDHFFLERR